MDELKELLRSVTTNKLEKKHDESGIKEDLIIEGKLTWQPWLGDNYSKSKKKTLIIGESHYYKPVSDNDKSFTKHQNINFTQIVVNEIAIKRLMDDKRSATMYENFYRSIKSDGQTRVDYWNSVAFYNFIQQPMHSIKQRPSKDMIKKAWTSFRTVVDIIQPDVVIFIGVKCSEGFNEFAKDINVPLKKEVDLKISSRQVPRSASLIIRNKNLPIYFIKHSSSFYSGKKWRNYFQIKGII